MVVSLEKDETMKRNIMKEISERELLGKLTPMAKFTLTAIGFIWFLAVTAVFVLVAAAEGNNLWHAIGGSSIAGAILGIIGTAVVACNWSELGLPRR